MRILISAYACEPHKGSEPEVGLQIALIAASEHEVWVITRDNNLPSLKDFLRDHPLRDRIHLIGLEVEGLAKRLKKRGGLLTLHWYYDSWQRALARLAVRLDADVDFDVVHHATFASYWTRAGVAAVQKPFVWGPIGGGVKPPFLLLPVMGLRGSLGDVVRLSSRPLVALLTGSRNTARRASVVLAQNRETASKLRVASKLHILPNALAAPGLPDLAVKSDEEHHDKESANVVAVGRLVGWKGTRLAIQAMTHIVDQTVTLTVYGDGVELSRLVRMTKRLDLDDRVRFMGNINRADLLSSIARAEVLAHVALHDDSPLAVAEALAVGTPVVMVNRGGAPSIADYWPDTPTVRIDPTTPGDTARRISIGLGSVIGRRGKPDTRPAAHFVNGILTAYVDADTQALSEHP